MCKNLTFEECEMTILRAAIDSSEKREGIKFRLRHLDKTFEEFIDFQINEISKR
jgi:hypothetical protein